MSEREGEKKSQLFPRELQVEFLHSHNSKLAPYKKKMLNLLLCFHLVLKVSPVNLVVSVDVGAVEKAGGKHCWLWNTHLHFPNWAETSLLKDAPQRTADQLGQMSPTGLHQPCTPLLLEGNKIWSDKIQKPFGIWGKRLSFRRQDRLEIRLPVV